MALAALLLPPGGEAQAQRNACGPLSSGAVTCSNQAYSGIRYDAAGGWIDGVAGDVALTVTGGLATTITTPTVTGWAGGIVVRTAVQGTSDSTSRTIALTVGENAAVAIAQSTAPGTDGLTTLGDNTGVAIHQRGKAADATTVTLGSGVTIGAFGTPMKKYGVTVLAEMGANTAMQKIESAATIHSTEFGLLMDNRGAGDSVVTNSGSITTTATGGAVGDKSGIRILDWSHNPSGGSIGGDSRTADTKTTVTNSGSIVVSAERAHGIHVNAEGLGLYKTVNSGTVSASGANGHGIFVEAQYHAGAAGSEAVVVESSGAITASGAGGHGIHVQNSSAGDPGDGNIAVTTTGGTIKANGDDASGILVSNASDGNITVTNAAAIEAAADGIHVGKNPANKGAIRIVNSAAIAARQYGIVVWHGGAADVRIENSGAIVPAPDANPAAPGANPARIGIHADQAAAGDIVIVNRADVTGSEQGIFVRNTEGGAEGGGAVTVTHSAGEISGGTGEGILAVIGRWRDEDGAESPAPNSTATVKVEVTGGSVKASETHGRVAIAALNHEGGSAEVSVSEGATVMATHNAGIYAQLADRQNTGGRIEITQGGTIKAEKGVYASVTRASAADETLAAAAQPLIDVAWTGTFTQAERTAKTLNNAAHAIEAAQEAQAGAAIRGAAHTAGIDAEIMSWRVLNRIATTGDDPGEIADAAAQAALLDTASTDAATKARAEYILTRFRSVLTAGTATIPGADAIDGDDDGSYSDAELVAYLSEDDAARRILLRDVLARDLSEAEQEVLEAVATGGDVDAALDDASFSAEYKADVRALLERHNVGDIRIAMSGGTIASSGDGIRAWFARQHDKNGAIAVTVAEGASVTGGAAGIYVSGAGTGLRIEKKYASPAVQLANPDMGPDAYVDFPNYLDQVVRVQGTVTGGADAAVHLVGGGALIVTGAGKLVAGSSGRAVLVNDPGPAVIYIEGEVTGGGGGRAAVDLTGGGEVTVGLDGRVRANGAMSAIRGDELTTIYVEGEVTGGDGGRAAVDLTGGGEVTVGLDGRVRANGAMSAIRGDNAPTAVILHTRENVRDLTQEQAREAVVARIEGGIVGDGLVTRETDGEKVITLAHARDGIPTGSRLELPVKDGEVDVSELPLAYFECNPMDGRCRLYEALPSILLAMNGLPTYAERMSAARDGTGAWARVETAGGEWTADRSTRAKVAYDYGRYGVRTGADVAVGENARLGASAHGFRGDAKVASSGEAKLWGMGAGVHATAALDGFYADAQAAATWYEVDLKSSVHDAPLKNEAKGRGYAVGVEAGRRVPAADGVSVTPRVGLAWSDVSLKDFTDMNGEKVSVKAAESLTGRVGASVELETGDGLRLFGSVDVTHEFSEETEAAVSGTALKASAERTTVRVGVGGSLDLGNGASLRGSAGYAVGGGGNRAFSGGLGMAIRF